MSTETEQFWTGSFGDAYLQRNRVDWKQRIPLFRKVRALTHFESVLEVGCNAGWNLRAINALDPSIDLAGCDINEPALYEAVVELPHADLEPVCAAAIADTWHPETFDMVLTAGVLIHIPPEEIAQTMAQIAGLAASHVLAIEYSHAVEREVPYRGHAARLWKRPYGHLYEALGLQPVWIGELGPQEGFGEGCTAWLLKKED